MRVSDLWRLVVVAGALLMTSGLRAAAPGGSGPVTERELAAIRAEVTAYRGKIGDRAGVPEVADTFIAVPKKGSWLTPAEARAAFAPAPAKLAQLRWWKIGLDPTRLEHALREPASVVSGCVHAVRGGLDGATQALVLAREAGDFLLWAQAEGGTGVFPFPAVRGVTRDKAFVAADRFLKSAEQAGRLAEVVHRGWAVDDGDDGGLQFDNGEAGLAVLELHAATGDGKYLAAARRAADWAAAHVLVKNWNYNSFSVSLLAEMFRATGERRDLDAAIRKARLGVIPGQLTDGPLAGRWVDPHNARPAYHYIMLRALAHLAAVMPAEHPDRAEVWLALKRGLLTRNREIVTAGVATKDKAMDALVTVHRLFGNDAAFLRDTRSAEALTALGQLVSGQHRRGGSPLGPREWGMFLEFAARRGEAPAATQVTPPTTPP